MKTLAMVGFVGVCVLLLSLWPLVWLPFIFPIFVGIWFVRLVAAMLPPGEEARTLDSTFEEEGEDNQRGR